MRDATGLVVGSPEWLEAQRKVERGLTPEKLYRQAVWQVVAGIVIIAIAVFTTVWLVNGQDDLGIGLRPRGFLTILVAPLLIGGYAIIHGIRQRRDHAP